MEILHDNPHFNAEVFFDICDKITNHFLERTMQMSNYVPEGIVHSDGLSICALSEMYGVDYLIESDRANGGTTEMFARYFLNHPRLKHIWSVN